MKLDLSKNTDVKRATDYLQKLISDKCKIELSKVQEKRTQQQNKYVHVLFCLFGIHTGYSKDEAKTIVKRSCSFMKYEKKGVLFLRSTADLNTKEMTDFIDWFRNWSSNAHGCYLPSPEEYDQNAFEIDRQIEYNKIYL